MAWRAFLHAIGQAPVVVQLNPDQCSRYLGDLKPALPQVSALAVLDAEGNSVLSLRRLRSRGRFFRPRLFQKMLLQLEAG